MKTLKAIFFNKSFKLILLVCALILYTIFNTRRSNDIRQKIDAFVQNELPFIKSYNPIIMEYEKIDSIRLKKIKEILGYNRITSNYGGLKIINDRFRLNDTLYIAQKKQTKNDSIVAMDKPRKYIY